MKKLLPLMLSAIVASAVFAQNKQESIAISFSDLTVIRSTKVLGIPGHGTEKTDSHYRQVNEDPTELRTITRSVHLPQSNTARTGGPCTTAADTWNDLNTAGGAPCFNGSTCATTDPGFATIGIYGSEAYLLDNVQAGFDYVFDMCAGVGAGAWIPEITILAPDGATIDATNAQSSTQGPHMATNAC